jgi:uncharacterized membrane protein
MNAALLSTILASVGGVLGKVLVSMVTSLFTEAVLKKLIVMALEKVVAKTENDIDNQVLAECIKAWYPEEREKEALPEPK